MYHILRSYLRLMLMVPFLRLFMFNDEEFAGIGTFDKPDLDELTYAYAYALVRTCERDWRDTERVVWTVQIQETLLSRLGFKRPNELRRELDVIQVSGGVYMTPGGVLWVQTGQTSPSGRGWLMVAMNLPALTSYLSKAELPDLMEGFVILAS